MSADAAVEALASIAAPTAPRARTAAAAVVVAIIVVAVAVFYSTTPCTAASHLLAVALTPCLPRRLREEQLPGVACMGHLLFFGVGVSAT